MSIRKKSLSQITQKPQKRTAKKQSVFICGICEPKKEHPPKESLTEYTETTEKENKCDLCSSASSVSPKKPVFKSVF
jgi:hypothetical protein